MGPLATIRVRTTPWLLPYSRISTPIALGSSRRCSFSLPSHLVALPEDSLQDLQAKNKQLRAAISSLRWPSLTSFTFRGDRYPLPYSPQDDSCGQATQNLAKGQLDYMAGFFDGDGCVSSHQDLSGCNLHVTQSLIGVDVLFLFQSAFGGSICCMNNGKGLRQPVLVWSLFGRKAHAAANRLASHSIVKQRQLQRASEWPKSAAERKVAASGLASLKRFDSGVLGPCSWEYLAGFFDAEGYIRQARATASVSLVMAQKYGTVLYAVSDFLLREMGLEVNVHKAASGKLYTLYIGAADSRPILEKMLESGLVRKAQQAKLALTLDANNASEIRVAMEQLVGHQMFGKRLNEAGLARASIIKRMLQRAHCRLRHGQPEEACIIRKEAESLKCQHRLLAAHHENMQLNEYARTFYRGFV